MSEPITSEALMAIGFLKQKRPGDPTCWMIPLREIDMGEHEAMAAFITRGTGSDLDCWDLKIWRHDWGFRPPDELMLRHGLKLMSEITTFLAWHAHQESVTPG